MNIAMFADGYYPRINGVTTSVESYARKLSELGHHVVIVAPSYPIEEQKNGRYIEAESDAKQPFSVLRLKSNQLVFSKVDRSVRRNQFAVLVRSLDAFKPDVLHINSEWVLGGFALRYSKLRGTPVVFTLHTLWEKYILNYTKIVPASFVPLFVKTVEHRFISAASQLIVPTELIRHVAERYGASCNITILPTGIPDFKLNYNKTYAAQIKAQLLEKFPALAGKRILVYVGRPAKEKNMPFLLSAFEQIKATHKDTALLIVGGGPVEGELHAIANKSKYRDSIVFTGFVSSEDVTYYYSLADVFVFPSKTETQGLVTLEAMRCGIPVVAIGEMGTVDVMQGDHGGFMVEDDTAQFVQKVNLLLDDEKLRTEKAKEAALWGSKWSLKILTPQLVTVYENAVKSRGAN